jgi:hypothetical protein
LVREVEVVVEVAEVWQYLTISTFTTITTFFAIAKENTPPIALSLSLGP